MATPDPLNVRMFNNTVARHRHAAIRDAADIAEKATRLVQRLKEGASDAGEARRLHQTVTDLVQRTAALDALNDMAFLATDPFLGEGLSP